MTTHLEGHLEIRGLELQVNLGWRDKELLAPQAILLDIDIYYLESPDATSTDDLADTVCYAELIEKIREHINQKKYRLIEHLSHDIYQLIHPAIPSSARYVVKITKKPKIKGLTGGVSYSTYKSCRKE